MGFLEHGIILSQLILNFKYGTWRYGAFIMIAYAVWFVHNIVFMVLHYKRVTKKDKLYNNWRNRPTNIWARRLMNWFTPLASWKVYKLTYSHFYGVKLTPARFTKPKSYRDLQRCFLYIEVFLVYALLIVVNCYGLYDLDWGTQLYI